MPQRVEGMAGALENQRCHADLGPDLGCWFFEMGRFRLTLGFRWPAARARGVISRKPKAFDHCHKPRLVLTGAIAHGWCTDFYLSHDGIVSHGCSMFCEILEQTIARVAAICARDGLEMPSHLCVQSDNTTSQAKNSQACESLSGEYRLQRLMHDVCHGGHIPTYCPPLYDVSPLFFP